MATFRVGQRVRLVYTYRLHHLLGVEATIVFVDENDPEQPYEIKLKDSIEANQWPRPHQLEPVQHDGNKTISWDICCWQPEHLRENVHEHETA